MLILNMMPAACHKQVWIGATKTGKVVKSKNTFETFETGKQVHWQTGDGIIIGYERGILSHSHPRNT